MTTLKPSPGRLLVTEPPVPDEGGIILPPGVQGMELESYIVVEVEKRMPIDFEAVENGNLEIVDWTRKPDEDEWTPVVRYLLKGEGDTLPGLDVPDRYVSHFATCPNARSHRKS